MKLAIFDFDGTISNKDSFIDFLFFTHGKLNASVNFFLLSPILILYFIKIFPGSKTKQMVFSLFFKGWEEEKFNQCSYNYATDCLPKIIKSSARERLAWHKKEGHKIVIASASFENYLSVWCQKQGFDCLATKVETKNHKLTGNFSSLNCHGEEKVRRIKEKYNLNDYDFVYAYGDSPADKALEQIANEFHYRSFY